MLSYTLHYGRHEAMLIIDLGAMMLSINIMRCKVMQGFITFSGANNYGSIVKGYTLQTVKMSATRRFITHKLKSATRTFTKK